MTTTIVTPISLVDRAQQVEDLVRGGRVELAGGFVGEQNGRLVGERDGDRDALLLAARQAVRPVVGTFGQADSLEQVLRRAAAGRAGRPRS